MSNILKIVLNRAGIVPRHFSTAVAATNTATTPTTPGSDLSDEPVNIRNPYKQERKLCILCRMKIHPDYKNVRLLSQFQSPYTGRIYGRHITGLCKAKHDLVQREIFKSQNSGFMGTYTKSVDFTHDPRLFDPERPMRPHKY
ncbi:28S ribosomal protein S18c, mitochondrial [Pseudolycoriella hygida]|uniref:28S ribosomal protein S18c, mitochondrial n=1 Tax=Pseudolycoriella hygida TaxID=35572 RepID=A0A9Q0MXU8_9DIPT|nr:28S ribosomal protein S18c, mitochondrial [Pseudolycoriella hygida]